MTGSARLTRILALLAVTALIAVGCGGDDDDDKQSLQAGETAGDTGADTDAESGGKEPIGKIELDTEYTITIDQNEPPLTLSIPPGSVTTVKLEAAPANASTVGLSSSDGSLSAFAEPGGENEDSAPIITAAEDGLELSVTPQGVLGDRFTFTIENNPQPDDPDGGDAPAIITGAIPIDGSTDGLLGGPDTTDYYGFTAEGGDIVSFTLSMAGDAEGSVNAALEYNGESRGRVSASPGGSEDGQVILAADEGGDWYVNVSGSGEYTLEVETAGQTDGGSDGDAPDSTTGAVVVEPGTFPGSLGDADTTDFYEFELPAGAVVSVELTNDAASYSTVAARLLFNGEQRGRASTASGGSESFTATFPASESGKGYLEVTGPGASYEITLKVTQQNDGGSKGDAADESGKPTAIKVNKTVKGNLGDEDRVDIYSATVPAGTLPVSLTVAPDSYSSVAVRILSGGDQVARVSAAAGGTESVDAAFPGGPVTVEVTGPGAEYSFVMGTDPEAE